MEFAFAELLTHGFIQRALIAGSFISILCSTLGIFLVLRRLSLIGDGLAHVTFGSVAVGLLFRASPFYVAIPIVMFAGLGILKLIEKARLYGDAAIGVVSSIGISAGVIIASVAGGFNVDLFSYLFGNILAINTTEVIISIVLSVVLLVLLVLFYEDLFATTFSEDAARTSGIKTTQINRVLVLLIGLTVVLAMKVVGIMLISALLILPPVTALQIARSFRATIFISASTGLISVILGIFISFLLNFPTGATVVIINFLLFITGFAIGRVRAGYLK
ncbi:MAG TPA: metal ABC transporter permease [Syntrophorhabdaceae bacterium]|nr:metal ABC transporter permease [Syntrophorhabdaceae bacterium]